MKKKTFTHVFTLFLAIMLTVSLTACGNGVQPSQTEDTSAAPSASPSAESTAPSTDAKETELKVMIHVNYDGIHGLFDAFMEKYPNIKVNIEVGQHVDTGVYSAILASGDAPDVLMIGSGASRIMPLAEAGLIEDLTDKYSERGWLDRVSPSTVDALKRSSNGHLYEVSCGMDVFTVKYYKSEFKKLGLEPPKTYEEFIGLMQALKDAGRLPMSLGVKDGVMAGHIISSFWQSFCGRDVVADLLYGDKKFTDPEVVAGAQALNDLKTNGYINKDCTSLSYLEATAVFAAKNASTFLCLQGYLDPFVKEGLDLNDIGSFVIPSKDSSQPSLPIAGLSQCWVVPTNGGNKESVCQWLDFTLNDDYIKAQIKYEDTGTWNMGIGTSIPSDPSILDGIQHPLVKAAFQSLEDGYGYNCSPYLTGNLKTTYFESIQNMLLGVITPEKAMETLQKAKAAQATS